MSVVSDLPQPGAGMPLAFHPKAPDVLIYGGNVPDALGAVLVTPANRPFNLSPKVLVTRACRPNVVSPH